MGSVEYDEELNDRRQQQKNQIMDEWEEKVRKEYQLLLGWFENHPQEFDNYLTEDEKLDLAYEIIIAEGKGEDLEDVVQGYRERKAWEEAEHIVEKPVFTN